ncbi:MAG: hypothetical protein E7Z93_04780 [Cyanobacteria bacterium SIG32]|nr:hypothetical protein [Cyanobacteria bacterium SIG32]
MKKLLLTFLILSAPVYAFENYMVISNSPVKSVTVQNKEILDAKPVFTIDNQKKIIIITPKSNGKTKINIDLFDKKETLDIKIDTDKTTIKLHKGFNYFSIDIPPEEYIIPLPPANEILPEPPKFKGGK